MKIWCEMLVQGGGGLVGLFFTQEIISQRRHLPVLIEDYPYAGMDYREDPEMPQPPR